MRRASSCARRITTRWATARSATACAAAKLRLAAFCAILAPGVPLLFMGEEYDEGNPFLFFADHIDPEIARGDARGPAPRVRALHRLRRTTTCPIPERWRRSCARSSIPTSGDPEHREYYRWLLALRRTLPPGPIETTVDEEARFLRVRRGDVELLMNFSAEEHDGVPPWSGAVR